MTNSFSLTVNLSPNAAILKSGDLRVHGYAYSKNNNPKTGKPNCRDFDFYINSNQKWLMANMHESDLYTFNGYIVTRKRELARQVNGAWEPFNYNESCFVVTSVTPHITKADKPLLSFMDLRLPKQEAVASAAAQAEVREAVMEPVTIGDDLPF